jgi:hypothetical protein
MKRIIHTREISHDGRSMISSSHDISLTITINGYYERISITGFVRVEYNLQLHPSIK